MTARTTMEPCRVCEAPAKCVHFGVRVCRACAAFFRRTVTHKINFVCIRNKKCRIYKNGRFVCRACRLTKCYDMGMDPKYFQPSKKKSISTVKGKKEHAFEPILPRLRIAYKKLNEKRLEIYAPVIGYLGEGSEDEATTSRQISYAELLEMHQQDVGLNAEFLRWAFPECAAIAPKEMAPAYQEFFLKFLIIECAFLTAKSGQNRFIVVPAKRKIDFALFETYTKCDGTPIEGADELRKFMHPLAQRNVNTQIEPMRRLEMDETEFLVLVAMAFWVLGVEGLRAETETLGKKMRKQLVDELFAYSNKREDLVKAESKEADLRLARIFLLLPVFHNFCQTLHGSLELSDVLQLYETQHPATFDMVF